MNQSPVLFMSHVLYKVKTIEGVPHTGISITTPLGTHLVHNTPKSGPVTTDTPMSSAWVKGESIDVQPGKTAGGVVEAVGRGQPYLSENAGICYTTSEKEAAYLEQKKKKNTQAFFTLAWFLKTNKTKKEKEQERQNRKKQEKGDEKRRKKSEIILYCKNSDAYNISNNPHFFCFFRELSLFFLVVTFFFQKIVFFLKRFSFYFI